MKTFDEVVAEELQEDERIDEGKLSGMLKVGASVAAYGKLRKLESRVKNADSVEEKCDYLAEMITLSTLVSGVATYKMLGK